MYKFNSKTYRNIFFIYTCKIFYSHNKIMNTVKVVIDSCGNDKKSILKQSNNMTTKYLYV